MVGAATELHLWVLLQGCTRGCIPQWRQPASSQNDQKHNFHFVHLCPSMNLKTNPDGVSLSTTPTQAPCGPGHNSPPERSGAGPGTECDITLPGTFIGDHLGLEGGRECLVPYILLTRLTENKRATRNSDANNHITVHHQLTNHNIDLDTA